MPSSCTRRCALHGAGHDARSREFAVGEGDSRAVHARASTPRTAGASCRIARQAWRRPTNGGATGRTRLAASAPTVGLARGGRPLADHAQGADLRADRRHRRGADDLAAGGARRRAQLGLPLLLDPRCDASRSTRCSMPATSRRRRPWRDWLLRAVGRASRRSCRSCTASPASGG